MIIPFFPYPYPNEWWYSVLARFAQQSGCMNHKQIHEMLFGEQNYNCAKIIPKGSFSVLNRLPENFLSAEDIIWKHSVIPLYMRFWSAETQNICRRSCFDAALTSHIKLDSRDPYMRFGARFCPKCCEEDEKQYGEAYWHREHQIPLLLVCIKHRCRLRMYERTQYHLSAFLEPLSNVKNDISLSQNEIVEEWELKLAEIIKEYFSLPSNVHRPERDNNLITAIALQYNQQVDFRLNNPKFLESLNRKAKTTFGEVIFSRYFGKGITQNSLHNLKQWRVITPERYLLLQCMVDLSPNAMFSNKSLKDNVLINILQSLKKQGENLYFATDIAAWAGITTTELVQFAQRNKIPKFWKTKSWKDY